MAGIRGRRFKYIATAAWLSMLASMLALMLVWGNAPAQPPCRTSFDDPEFALAAGCMIRYGHRMLAVRHRLSGKLGFPAGFAENGESAQCVAHRETWEETGLDVVVHAMLKRFGNGFVLYHCELTDARATDSDELAVPKSGVTEVSQVVWIDPHATTALDWRFPRQYPVILDLIDQ